MQNESVAGWLARLKAGDAAGAQPLWERYFARLVALARSRMTVGRAAADEEDVALSAFNSFCAGAAAGRFPRLGDRDDLWRLLVVIVTRKARDHARSERRLKRGGGATAADVDLADILASDPTPDFAAAVAERCEVLLERLNDATLRAVAVWKMEGYTADEIAAKMGCATRTVGRKLRLIRELWAGAEDAP